MDMGVTHEKMVHRALIEWRGSLDLLDVLVRESDVESLDVCLQVLYLPTADDWKHMRHLMHHIRYSH